MLKVNNYTNPMFNILPELYVREERDGIQLLDNDVLLALADASSYNPNSSYYKAEFDNWMNRYDATAHTVDDSEVAWDRAKDEGAKFLIITRFDE